MQAYASRGRLTTEAEMMAQIVKKIKLKYESTACICSPESCNC